MITETATPTRAEWKLSRACIVPGNLLSAAAVGGIITGPMEGYDRYQVDVILGLRDQDQAARVITNVGCQCETGDTQH